VWVITPYHDTAVRPGKALLGAGRAEEVLIRCRTPLEQVRRRIVPEPCERPSRGKEQCGAALRGRPCGISWIRSDLLFDPRMGGDVEPKCYLGMLRKVGYNFILKTPIHSR